MRFHDRTHAAFLLAEELKKYSESNGVILAIPRGAVPMGYTLAHQLGLPLDLIMVKKIGHPFNSEYAIGSVSLTDVILSDTEGIDQSYIQEEVLNIRKAMKEKYTNFMGNKKPVDLKGKIVILVDDGLATGNTMLACIEQVRKSHPQKIIVAVPVASDYAYQIIKQKADEIICLYTSSDFYAVGQFYEKFDQVSDEAVAELIKKSTPIACLN